MADQDHASRVISGKAWEDFCDALKNAGKEILRLHTGLAIKEAKDLGPDALNRLANEIGDLYTAVARSYFA